MMANDTKPEFWLSGPVDGLNALLQPVAHALLQARREVEEIMQDFPDNHLWERPSGVASVGFHLQHLSGVLDRLCTYARGEQLSGIQMDALKKEGQAFDDASVNTLVSRFHEQVENTLLQLQSTGKDALLEVRYVGRKMIPSNVIGLLFHAAEHTQRHTGQLLVTARIICDQAHIKRQQP
jgi:uncharacterized damage-inducible protein DinB